MLSYKYSGWDGTQSIDLNADDILSALADDLLERGDPRQALRRLMQRGMRGQNLMGLQQLLQRLKQRREQRLDQYNLGSVIDELEKALQEILQLEREGIDRRVSDAQARTQPPSTGSQPAVKDSESQPSPEEGVTRTSKPETGDLDPEQAQRLLEFMEKAAQQKRDFLQNLPKGLGGALKELQEYDFWDAEAKQKYDELMERLKQQMAQSMFQDLMQGMQGMQGMSPEQMQALREMMRDLNQMLRERMEGKQPNFQQFMDKWGQAFGDNPPQSLNELLEQLHDRMQQMQSLMDSLSAEQRQQMQDLMDSMMSEMGMQEELQELAYNLAQMFPGERPQDYAFRGDDPLTLQEAMRLMEEMSKFEDLDKQLRSLQFSDDIPESTVEEVRRLLGEEDAQQLENLRELARKLEEAGYLQRRGDRLELTARALRKLGQKALKDVFEKLKRDRVGNHNLERRGLLGDRDDETKQYEFGDPFHLDLHGTVRNAVERQGPGVPVHIAPADFDVFRTEHQTRCATVLLLDQSRSMGYTGRFLAAKKMALALESLIRTQFPRDDLYLVGFAAYATEIKHNELPKVTWSYDASGTNMQHALMLSRQFLARHRGGTRQIIMVTDGEPTAHLERGYAYFAYPPTHRTIQETLREVQRCAREGIVINTFMLEQSYYLMEFVGQMARLNKGRVFYTSPDKLSEYVLVDYLGQKKRRVSD